MSKLAALTQAQLDRWVTQAQLTAYAGRLPEHIPLLANPDRCHEVAIQVRRVEQQVFSGGAVEYRFPLMSLIKPFALLYVLQQSGHQRVLHYVDMKPSEHSFNSLAQLEIDHSKGCDLDLIGLGSNRKAILVELIPELLVSVSFRHHFESAIAV